MSEYPKVIRETDDFTLYQNQDGSAYSVPKTSKPSLTAAAVVAAFRGDRDNAIAAITPGGIYAQEATGQARLVQSQQMPIRNNSDGVGTMENSRKVLEKLGFKVGEVVDDIFFNTDMPPGWTREATNHSMHSYVLDEKGRRRIHIFFKAAFYDYNAHMDIVSRFSGGERPECGWDAYDFSKREDTPYVAYVTDCGKEIWVSEPYLDKRSSEGRKLATDWLDAHYPDWRDPLAYWDAE